MTLLRYRTTGTLTGTIEPENVAQAMQYLTDDDMTQYLDGGLEKVVMHIRWHLNSDGHTWYVEALTKRELKPGQNRALAQWVSGQNSDGLGEGFEQQDFAWNEDTCNEDEDCEGGCEDGRMISFDWKTNDCAFERVP